MSASADDQHETSCSRGSAPRADCHVAVLTPPGRGAVATIGVAGPQATQLVAPILRAAAGRPLIDVPLGRIVFGRWCAAQTPSEEVVVCRRAADEIEIHCHGGRLAAGAIVGSLVAGGAREISWQEFAGRREPGHLETEVRQALAAARTERTAAILLDQWRGELRSSLGRAVAWIQNGRAADAAAILHELERSASVGLHLVDPWRVVLTGRPNVGKSSLINAILGFERCIVHAAPGTTRDVVTAQTALDGWPVELADTAGWRDSSDEVEAAGLEQARTQLRQADLIVLMFDVSADWTSEDQSLLAAWSGAVVVHNKCDLSPAVPQGRPPGLMVSAAQGVGIDVLVRELGRRLVPEPPRPAAAVLLTQGQVRSVQAARSALAAGDHRQALTVLNGLLAARGPDF
ncbi:MAG: 50S ribosome-binding GTPase [Pirellulaceae bacterium]|nr:50S ribosome-binding GTPase [Pirellulaceae bacterium]